MPAWDYDSAVIGAGPGGMVSALYLGRFRRSVALINCGVPRAAWIPKTHNLIGYDRGISGPDLLRRLGRQLGKLKVDRTGGEARVSRLRSGFEVSVGGRRLTARKVILATGILDVQPDLANLSDLRTRGLLRYCPICDAYDYRGRDIAVLARDDEGLQSALFLARFARSLKVFLPTGFQPATQRVAALRRWEARIYRGSLLAIERARSSKGVFVHAQGHRPVHAAVAYAMLGTRVPDAAFAGLKGLRRSDRGFLIATTEQRTSIAGLFAVGDCVNLLGQISVAAGQAAVAATTLHNDLLDE